VSPSRAQLASGILDSEVANRASRPSRRRCSRTGAAGSRGLGSVSQTTKCRSSLLSRARDDEVVSASGGSTAGRGEWSDPTAPSGEACEKRISTPSRPPEAAAGVSSGKTGPVPDPQGTATDPRIAHPTGTRVLSPTRTATICALRVTGQRSSVGDRGSPRRRHDAAEGSQARDQASRTRQKGCPAGSRKTRKLSPGWCSVLRAPRAVTCSSATSSSGTSKSRWAC
jgi:hypothetical protein